MRTLITLLAACCFLFVSADGNLSTENVGVPKLELSLEPAGFVFYGPSLNLGVGLMDQLSLNAYVRMFGMGSQSVKLKSEPDENYEFSGTHFGLGTSYFFGTGSAPYVGVQIEFGSSSARYSEGELWEWYEDASNLLFALKGGYRLALTPAISVNLGAFVGSISMDNSWDYEDKDFGLSDPSAREHSDSKLIFAPEVGIGFTLIP